MTTNNQPTLGNGKICYLEIPAVDEQQSAAFYKQAFGWNIRERQDGHLSFDDTVNQVSGAWVKGRKPGTDPGLVVYVMVDDIRKSIEDVISAGGKIVQPLGADAPELTARFSDPAGNILGLYQEPE